MSNIIIAIGSLIIFGTFLSSSNRLMTGNTQIAQQNEYYIAALSLAQAVIDEAKTKAFDEQTVSAKILVPSGLTSSDSLGKEGSAEATPIPDTLGVTGAYSSFVKFDDIDDYNSYSRLINTPRAEGYRILVKVNYASETYPDSSRNIRTFCKKLAVFVTSPFFPKIQKAGILVPDTLQILYAFTY
ncbi:MAG: hypothetical protein HY707_09960 [Ignavibacteriae bacterium]|nr:hypothetical protein [Ignavibacteriota bacterium]